MEYFNPSGICWRDNTVDHKQSRGFLESVDDKFLLKLIEAPVRRGAILDLVLTYKKGLVGNVKVKRSLGCSDQCLFCFLCSYFNGTFILFPMFYLVSYTFIVLKQKFVTSTIQLLFSGILRVYTYARSVIWLLLVILKIMPNHVCTHKIKFYQNLVFFKSHI